jgi:adenosylcobinamide-phosphate synthase
MLLHADALAVLLIALAADALIGDPDILWRRWPHPVAWIGWLIAALDRRLNHDGDSFARRKALGVLALAVVMLACGGVALKLDAALRLLPGHPLTSGVIASVLIAQNSLHAHVARVRKAFVRGGLAAARRAVSMIVGRDPESLDEAGVCRAAIETTAENFSDGIVAPAFWFAVLGLPGLVLYKAINTADSMIGHRSARHEAFGWAAARLDDAVNLVPARLAGLLLALAAPLAGGSVRAALSVMMRDARLHRSPNAGWPEAAMAGGLGLALAGPRRYGARLVDDPFLNPEGRTGAMPDDIGRALRVLAGACALQFALLAALWLALA